MRLGAQHTRLSGQHLMGQRKGDRWGNLLDYDLFFYVVLTFDH
ncbi:hypothetical protein SLEP1_g39028 [Rubroshorea leprosula]|uniref:Uncharacterized protein n=1 Tax=Rubroshorea leprosula TaxID=152421 RepID=A0AAV5KZ71_9ROSI|nr:hypothetical protein SLEP1_g39028 [Rubroshorea leprosula]